MNGRLVGELTSAGYSRRLGRVVVFGYAKSPEAGTPLSDAMIEGARFAIDIAGRCCEATVHLSKAP